MPRPPHRLRSGPHLEPHGGSETLDPGKHAEQALGDELGGHPQSACRRRCHRPNVRLANATFFFFFLCSLSILIWMRSIIARAEKRLERIYGPCTTKGKPSHRSSSSGMETHLTVQHRQGSHQSPLPKRDSRKWHSFRRINYSHPLHSPERVGKAPKVTLTPFHSIVQNGIMRLQVVSPTKVEPNRALSLIRTRIWTHNTHP